MADQAPKVSVCLPVYNGAPYVGQAVASVLEQTFSDFELLVADNASTDGTLDVVGRYADPRIRVLRSDVNLGPGKNWNRVVRAARGDLVKLLCADDWLYPGCLSRQVEVMDADPSSRIVLVTAARDVVDGRGRRLVRRGYRGPVRVVGGSRAVHAMVRRGANLVGEPSAALFRRAAGLAAGLFDEDATYVVDMSFWLRLLRLGDLCMLGQPLCAFRVQGGSWSVAAANSQARDMRALLESVASDPLCDVRRWEARLGIACGSVDALLRRLFYATLARGSLGGSS